MGARRERAAKIDVNLRSMRIGHLVRMPRAALSHHGLRDPVSTAQVTSVRSASAHRTYWLRDTASVRARLRTIVSMCARVALTFSLESCVNQVGTLRLVHSAVLQRCVRLPLLSQQQLPLVTTARHRRSVPPATCVGGSELGSARRRGKRLATEEHNLGLRGVGAPPETKLIRKRLIASAA